MGYTFQAPTYMNGYHFHIKSISMGYPFHPKSIWMGKIWNIVYEWGQFSIWEVYEWDMFCTWPSIWMGWFGGSNRTSVPKIMASYPPPPVTTTDTYGRADKAFLGDHWVGFERRYLKRGRTYRYPVVTVHTRKADIGGAHFVSFDLHPPPPPGKSKTSPYRQVHLSRRLLVIDRRAETRLSWWVDSVPALVADQHVTLFGIPPPPPPPGRSTCDLLVVMTLAT